MSRYSERRLSTPNVSPRRNLRLGVVFHHTGGGYEGACAWLRDPKARASAHVVIAKDGRRTILAADTSVTWHAGKAFWAGHGARDVNGATLGVEFELTADDVQAGVLLTDAQIESAMEWLAPRAAAYGWEIQDMSHHAAVCRPVGRKADLSPANWQRVRAAAARLLSPTS